MIVLSLCDGIGGGRIALDRAGIKVDRYFASEIDKNAIKCANNNWDDIIHIGDIRNVSYKNGVLSTENGNYAIPHIDLLMSGTPCQSFSTANIYNRNGLEGKSRIFLEALRILHEVNPTYFLFENVKMKKEYKSQLDEYLGVSGVEINSKLVSYQNRPRIYWTNFPITVPDDMGVSFQDYVERNTNIGKLNKSKCYLKMWADGKGNGSIKGGCLNVTYADKIRCVTTKQKRCPNAGLVECEDFCRILTQRELELAQTLPVGYTNGFSYNQAEKLIGNGWTIDVIVHLLKHLTKN